MVPSTVLTLPLGQATLTNPCYPYDLFCGLIKIAEFHVRYSVLTLAWGMQVRRIGLRLLRLRYEA